MGESRLPILVWVVLIAVVLIEGYAYLDLENLSNVLIKENEELRLHYDDLQTRYERLSISYDGMEQEYEGLRLRYAQLDALHTSLENEYFWLQRQHDELGNASENQSQEIAEGNGFVFYYASLAKQRFGVEDLEGYLDRWEWSEGVYKEGVFDCSEMSAYIEWKLENEGYHVDIVSGTTPWSDGNHTWLLVETSLGYYMPVEATTYDLVKWDSPYFDKYFEYGHKFETIQDALAYAYEEFDWWQS